MLHPQWYRRRQPGPANSLCVNDHKIQPERKRAIDERIESNKGRFQSKNRKKSRVNPFTPKGFPFDE